MGRPFRTSSVTKSSKAVISSALVREFVRQVRRDNDDPFGVANDDVAREHRRIAAADRPIDLDGLMQS